MYVNARALIERRTPHGPEIVVQTRNKPGEAPRVELPGGQVEEFESLIAALRREVREETGLTVTAIEGLETLMEIEHNGDLVECVRPFAVYQTLKGPVDSINGCLLSLRSGRGIGCRWRRLQGCALGTRLAESGLDR